MNLNTCPDPDCGNYGISPDPIHQSFVGRGAAQRRLLASVSNPAIGIGLGRYKMEADTNESLRRVSRFLEYEGDPREWYDGRTLVCQHCRGNAECGLGSIILSNRHFADEAERLASQNGLLDGPRCGACGTRYLDRPEEFAFNGANGKTEGRSGKEKATGIRVVHRPCRGDNRARFTVSAEHCRQKDRKENITILHHLVNGAGINDLRRLLTPEKGRRAVGVKHIYNRILWLERVLLAFEQAQLKSWKRRLRAKERWFRHTRISHDDVVLGCNWETSTDRRITALNCAVSADVRSGYVFRADVDFDPTVDPVRYIDETYLGATGKAPALRKVYTPKGGEPFTAPQLAFQRPSGRYDEAALFAAAFGALALFVSKTTKAYERAGASPPTDVAKEVSAAKVKAWVIWEIANLYFGFAAAERDYRNSFTGIMTRDIYTKAASLACLKDMVPHGKITLISEQEAAMARVVPHIFRDMIVEDLFEWHVITYDKTAKKPAILRRTAEFQDAFRSFRQANPKLEAWEALHIWTEQRLVPAFRQDADGNETGAFPISNFATRAAPPLWLHSPIQAAGETNKVVGFPILSPRYRAEYRRLTMRESLKSGPLRDAITRRVIHATLQPAATFCNALRERVSFARRAGGRAARSGPSYINGACFNPRILIAVLNIYRVYYNFFELRQYVSPLNKHEATDYAPAGTKSIKVPGSETLIEVPQERRLTPILRTPAMRAGIHEVDPEARSPALPDLSHVLYQPWLFHGTPLWAKLQGR
jgi:hypothetical protein